MKKLSFEAAMDELEEIVHQLESGEISLENSLKLLEKGTKLSLSLIHIFLRLYIPQKPGRYAIERSCCR